MTKANVFVQAGMSAALALGVAGAFTDTADAGCSNGCGEQPTHHQPKPPVKQPPIVVQGGNPVAGANATATGTGIGYGGAGGAGGNGYGGNGYGGTGGAATGGNATSGASVNNTNVFKGAANASSSIAYTSDKCQYGIGVNAGTFKLTGGFSIVIPANRCMDRDLGLNLYNMGWQFNDVTTRALGLQTMRGASDGVEEAAHSLATKLRSCPSALDANLLDLTDSGFRCRPETRDVFHGKTVVAEKPHKRHHVDVAPLPACTASVVKNVCVMPTVKP